MKSIKINMYFSYRNVSMTLAQNDSVYFLRILQEDSKISSQEYLVATGLFLQGTLGQWQYIPFISKTHLWAKDIDLVRKESNLCPETCIIWPALRRLGRTCWQCKYKDLQTNKAGDGGPWHRRPEWRGRKTLEVVGPDWQDLECCIAEICLCHGKA